MSHASLIVALSLEQIEKYGGVEPAVDFQMKPFDENGSCFKNGSRWDWYSIGGRYTGKFLPDYEPGEDPANQERCWICAGTGMRNDELGREERAKNPAYTCNGCDGKGVSTMFPSKWVQKGNVCRRADLDETKLLKAKKKSAEQLWQKWLAEPNKSDINREFRYGFKPGETLESLIAEYTSSPLSAYAFLKDRRWCENERMGWFGSAAATECQRKAAAEGVDYEGRCIHESKKMGAKIVTWGEDQEQWTRLYWPRFVRNLPPETVLVCVDYHV